MTNQFFQKIKRWVRLEEVQLSTVAAVATGLFSFGLGKESLWLDEIYTYYASNTFANLVATIGWKERNMWLFHVLMYFWKFLGPGEVVMRSLAVVFAVGGVIGIYYLGKEIGGKKLGWIAVLLLTLNTFYLRYAQEARGYSLFICLFIFSSLFLLRIFKTNTLRNRIFYIVFTGLSLYSQLFAIIFIGIQVCFLTWGVIKKRISFISLLQIGVGIFVFFLPLVVSYIFANTTNVVSRTQGVLSWIVKPTWETIYAQFYMSSSDSILLFILYMCLVCLSLYSLLRTQGKISKISLLYLFFTTILPVLFIFIFSLYIKPLFIARYIIFTLPSYLLLVAIGISRIKNKYVFIGLSLVIILLNIKSIVLFYSSYKKEQWRQSVAYIYQYTKKDEKIIVFPQYLQLPFNYYAQQYPDYNRHAIVVPFPDDNELTSQTVSDNLNKVQSETKHLNGVWVISRKDIQPKQLEKEKKMIDGVLLKEYKKRRVIPEFTALELEYYSK